MDSDTALVAREDFPLDKPKGGRPKGSKNKITLLKLMAEEAVRSNQLEKMLEVCNSIIEDAAKGDFACRKLVWQSIMSKSGFDQNTPSGAVPEIVIRSDKPPEIHNVHIIEGDISDPTQEEDTNG